jgi:hypothetical protein
VRQILLLALVLLLLGEDSLWAQGGRRRSRQQSTAQPTSDQGVLPPAAQKAAETLAFQRSPTPVGENPTSAELPVYYFDGRMHWCGLPDKSVWVWTGSIWVPPGVIYWGNQSYDTAARSNSQSNPQSQARGLWIHSRFNVESQDYRTRYGNDAYFRYGPGHFID